MILRRERQQGRFDASYWLYALHQQFKIARRVRCGADNEVIPVVGVEMARDNLSLGPADCAQAGGQGLFGDIGIANMFADLGQIVALAAFKVW